MRYLLNLVKSFFPSLFLLVGAIIHIVGLSQMVYQTSFSLWNTWVNVSMLIIDFLAFLGLLTKKKWGFYLAAAIFVLFGLEQLSLGILHFTSWTTSVKIQSLGMLIGTFIVCVIASGCLYLDRCKYL